MERERKDEGMDGVGVTVNEQEGGEGEDNARNVGAEWVTAATIMKVITSMVMDSTAMGPQSLLSRRSNIVTEIVLVRAVKRRIVAESSRMEPMKMKIHVAMTPLRIRGAVTSKSVRSRVAPNMRPASSSSGCTDFSEAAICW